MSGGNEHTRKQTQHLVISARLKNLFNQAQTHFPREKGVFRSVENSSGGITNRERNFWWLMWVD